MDRKKLLSWVTLIAVIVLLPLPFALVLSGVDFLASGSAGVPKEFLVSYFFGMFTLIVGYFWYMRKAK